MDEELQVPDRAGDDLDTLARGSALNFLGILGSGAATLGLLVVLSRGLGAQGGGAFFEAMALFNIAIVVAALGSDTGLVRFIARSRGFDDRFALAPILRVALVPVACSSAAIGVAGVLAAGAIGRGLGGTSHIGQVTDYVTVLAAFVPVGAIYVAILGASRGYETMLPTVAVDRVGKAVLQFAAVTLAIVAGVNSVGLALSWVGAIAAGLVAVSVWLRRLDRRGRPQDRTSRTAPSGVSGKVFWAFTLPRAFAAIFRVAILWSDVLIVGALLSPRAAGIYAVSTRLLQFGSQIADAVGQATEPMFARVTAIGHRDRMQHLYQVATGWVVAATWPQYLAALLFATPLLRIFGTDFTDGATAVAILAASAMVGSGMGPVDVLLLMAGKSMWSLWNTTASLTVNITLNLVLIPRFGLPGAAVAWAASRVLANALPLVEVGAHLHVHPFGEGWRAAAASALLTFGLLGVVVRATMGNSLSALLVYSGVAATAYTFMLRRLRTDLALGALLRVATRSRRIPVSR